MKRILKMGLPVTIMAVLLTGCFLNVLDPGWDFTRDTEGNRVIADTPRMWQDFRSNVDRRSMRELQGDILPDRSWREYWEQWLVSLEKNRSENHDKKLAYILCARRDLNLPPLSDEWEDRFDHRWCKHFAATEGRHTRGLPEFARDEAR